MASRLHEKYPKSMGGRAGAKINQQETPRKGEKITIRAAQRLIEKNSSRSRTDSQVAP